MIDVFSVLFTSSYLLNSIVYLDHSKAEQLTSIPNIININQNEKILIIMNFQHFD